MLFRNNKPDLEKRLAELEDELNGVKDDIRDAVRSGDEERLIRLRARADILPVKIANAKIDVAKAELSELEQDRVQLKKEHEEAINQREKLKNEFKQIESKYEATKKAYETAGIKSRNTNSMDKNHRQIQEMMVSIKKMQQELEEHVANCR